MNGLIRIQSTSSLDLYIPVDSIKDIARLRMSLPSSYPMMLNRTGLFDAPAYQLTERGGGGGASDNSNVQALIDAWDSVLRGQQSVAVVNFRFPIDRFARAIVPWP